MRVPVRRKIGVVSKRYKREAGEIRRCLASRLRWDDVKKSMLRSNTGALRSLWLFVQRAALRTERFFGEQGQRTSSYLAEA